MEQLIALIIFAGFGYFVYTRIKARKDKKSPYSKSNVSDFEKNKGR